MNGEAFPQKGEFMSKLPDLLARVAAPVPALDWQAEFSLLGRRLHIRTSDPVVLQSAEACFAPALADAPVDSVQVDILISAESAPTGEFKLHLADGCILGSDGGSALLLLPAAGRGWVLTSAAAIGTEAPGRERFIEFPALVLVARSEWYGLRAWLVARKQRSGLLLGAAAGELAPACAQAGMRILGSGLVYFDGRQFRGHRRPLPSETLPALVDPALAVVCRRRAGGSSASSILNPAELAAVLAAARLDPARPLPEAATLAPAGAYSLELGSNPAPAAALLGEMLR